MKRPKAKKRKKGKKQKKREPSVLTIVESFEMLEKYGIPIAKYEVAKKADKAAKAAKKIGFPIAMKAISKKATHKTDIGGIALGVESEKTARIAFKKISKNIKKAKADFDGVVVQEMIEKDTQEVIIGGKRDPQFGQTIAFGLGGIFVEVFEDITFRVVPIEKKDADAMIKEIKGYKILAGHRGKKYDTAALSKILMKVSKLLEKNEDVVELDINPVMVLKKGAVAVDARIVIG